MFNALIIMVMAALSLIIGAHEYANGNLMGAITFSGCAVGYVGLAGIYAGT